MNIKDYSIGYKKGYKEGLEKGIRLIIDLMDLDIKESEYFLEMQEALSEMESNLSKE